MSRGTLRRAELVAASGLVLVALAARVLVWQQRVGRATHESMLDTQSYREIAARLASSGWVDDRAFFMSPAYPYLMAVVSDSLLIVLQIVVAVAALAVLAWAVGRRWSRLAGWATLGLGALAAPPVLYDSSLLPDSLATSAVTLALAASLQPGARPARWMLLLGSSLAMGVVLRSNLLVLALLLVLLALRRRPAWRSTLALLLPLILALSTLSLLNHSAEGSWAPRSLNGGVNLYIGNGPASNGTYTTVNEIHPGDPMGRQRAEYDARRRLSTSEIEAFWRDRALQSMRDDPGRSLGLFVRKFAMSLHSFELPQMEDLALTERESWGLGLLPVRFGWLLGLAGLGLALGMRARRHEGLLAVLLVLGAGLLTCVLFFVNSRLRLPMWPALIVLGALGVEQVVAAYRARQLRPLLIAAVLALLVRGLPMFVDLHPSFVHARSAARYAALEAMQGDRRAARRWMLVMDEYSRHRSFGNSRSDLETTFQQEPDSEWMLRTEKAAALHAMGEDRAAFDELLAVTGALPDYLRAQRGLYEVAKRLVDRGQASPTVRAALHSAMQRLRIPSRPE